MPRVAKQKPLSAAITGAGGGLGRDIALGLAAKGYRVFGTAMAGVEITDLQQPSGGKVALSICAITDQKSVQNWARAVSHTFCAARPTLFLLHAPSPPPRP